jgi:nicotinate-nucleotide adenylyltransferase
MRIGILGGSFNPIHNGHIQIALSVMEKLLLDQIWIIPSGKHPFKPQDDLLDAGLRVKLIQKAIEHITYFELSFADLNCTKPSYTDELMKKLQHDHPGEQFFFIIGADNIFQLPKWHNWNWLVDHVQLVAVNRPDTNLDEIIKLDYASKIIFVNINPIPISSTMIRQYVKEGKSIYGLVPDCIEKDVVEYYGG